MSLLDKDAFLAQLTSNVSREVEDGCAICYEPVTSATETACLHIFCLECLTTWLQSASTCPHCRRELYQPEEEDEEDEDSDEEGRDEDEESEDQSNEESDEGRAARIEANRMGPYFYVAPTIHGYENLALRGHNFGSGITGTDHNCLVAEMQRWLNLVQDSGGKYESRNQNVDRVYVDMDHVSNIIIPAIIWLKEETRDGRFTLEEVCRPDWVLACVSVNNTLSKCGGSEMEAAEFRARLLDDVGELRREYNRTSPEYAESVFEDREPESRRSFAEQFQRLLDIMVDYAKDGYRPEAKWPENAAPLEGVRVDQYKVIEDVKEFEAFEVLNFVLEHNLDQPISFARPSESLGNLIHKFAAALLRIKPDLTPNAAEADFVGDDGCERAWAIVDDIVSDVYSELHGRRLRGEEDLAVSDLIDSLWEAMRSSHGKHWYWYTQDPVGGVELDLGWSTNGRFPSYGARYEGTSTFEKDMERLFAYIAYMLMQQYAKQQDALQDVDGTDDNASNQEHDVGSSARVPDEQLASLSLEDDGA